MPATQSSTTTTTETVIQNTAGFLLTHAELIQLAKAITKHDSPKGPNEGTIASLVASSVQGSANEAKIPVTIWNLTHWPENDPRKQTTKRWFFLPGNHQDTKYDSSHEDITKILAWFTEHGLKKEAVEPKWEVITMVTLDGAVPVVV